MWVKEGGQCDRGKMKVGPFGNLYVGVDSQYLFDHPSEMCHATGLRRRLGEGSGTDY